MEAPKSKHYRNGVALLCLCALACGSDAVSPTTAQVDAGSKKSMDAGNAQPARDSGARDAAAPLDAGLVGANAVGPSFCSRPGTDAVRDLFCTETPPAIRSLRDLQLLLQFGLAAQVAESPDDSYDHDGGPVLDAGATTKSDASYDDSYQDTTVVDGVVVIAHSTALSGHLVSPINPRAILLGNASLMTYQRGVQQVEVIAKDRESNGLNFFLFSFRQACNDREGGCSPGDLYTPRVETDWTEVSVRDDEDLKNTPLDCRQCHQRGRDRPMLLMRELQGPWTHFFEPTSNAEGDAFLPGVRGRNLVDDYARAKGDESYGSVLASTLRHTVGFVLQNLVPRDQPLIFDSPAIEDERWPFDGTKYASTPQPSATWQRGYEAFKRGEQLALPYFDPRPADAQKLAKLTAAYQQYRAGTLSADALPDLSDIFPDDPAVRAQIGLQTEPNATPAELLIQACGSCHNDVLDQTLSRARFSVDLSRMSRTELDLAIDRIGLTADAAGVMPPPEGRQLDAQGRARLLSYLRDNQRSADDDARLGHAAQQGMAGGFVP